jgi:hypothetical protein
MNILYLIGLFILDSLITMTKLLQLFLVNIVLKYFSAKNLVTRSIFFIAFEMLILTHFTTISTTINSLYQGKNAHPHMAKG